MVGLLLFFVVVVIFVTPSSPISLRGNRGGLGHMGGTWGEIGFRVKTVF